MLEIFLIARLAKKLAEIAKSKGRSGMWGALGVGGWICGEIIGFVIGFAMEMEMGAYGLALLGAAMGAGTAWFVVQNLDGVEQPALAFDEPLNPHYNPDNPYSPPRGA